jgi:UDP-N-acetylglucosamine diphosphorylase/glucosamine-1-phosphate N-acetyltransferase
MIGEQVAYAVLPKCQLTYCSPNTIDDCVETWKQTLPRVPGGGAMMEYPWHLIEHHGETLRQEALRHREQFGRCHRPSHLHVVGPSDRLMVDPTARIDPHVVADTTNGPVIIDKEAVVHSFSRLEGPCYVGARSQVLGAKLTNCAVGNMCRVGGEVEASILHSFSNKYHDGFLGHSYVGKWVNIAAGVQVSDLRHDYGPIRVTTSSRRVSTGLTKVGAFIGDHAKIGLGALVNTGSVFGAFCNVLPSSTYLPRWAPSFCRIENGRLYEQSDLHSLLITATEVMHRRGCELTVAYAGMVHALFDQTAALRSEAVHANNIRVLRKSA